MRRSHATRQAWLLSLRPVLPIRRILAVTAQRRHIRKDLGTSLWLLITDCSMLSTNYGPALGPSSAYSQDPRSNRGPSSPSADPVILTEPKKPQCWDHGCNGRYFSTFSNLLRHQREKSGSSTKSVCNRCGAEFTRKTARDGHLAHDKCKGGRRDRD